MGLLYLLPKPLLCRNSEFPKFSTSISLYQLLQLKTSHKTTLKTQCLHKTIQCKTQQVRVYSEPIYIHTHTPGTICYLSICNAQQHGHCLQNHHRTCGHIEQTHQWDSAKDSAWGHTSHTSSHMEEFSFHYPVEGGFQHVCVHIYTVLQQNTMLSVFNINVWKTFLWSHYLVRKSKPSTQHPENNS